MIVLHHTDPDGAYAAHAAWRANPDATLIGVTYGDVVVNGSGYLVIRDESPIDTSKEDVVLLDFSLDKDAMLDLCGWSKSVTVIDHHKTARELLDLLEHVKNLTVKIDLEKSAAVLASEHFHPEEPVHWMYLYVQDRDLWTWDLYCSKEVSASIYSRGLTMRDIDEVFAHQDPTAIIKEGMAILDYEAQLVQEIVETTGRMVHYAGHDVPAINSASLRSEIGAALSPDHPFVIVYYAAPDGSWRVSMRSCRDNPEAVDVAEIAARYEIGGGHKHAAGFTCGVLPF